MKTLLPALALLFGTGCVLVEAGINDFSVFEEGLAVEGVLDQGVPDFPPALAASGVEPGELSGRSLAVGDVETEFPAHGASDIIETFDDLDADAEVYFRRLTLEVNDGFDDLSTIDRLQIALRAAEGSSLPDVILVECGAPCRLEGSRAEFESSTDENLIEWLQAGDPTFVIRFGGALPIDAWTVDVEGSFEAKASAHFGL